MNIRQLHGFYFQKKSILHVYIFYTCDINNFHASIYGPQKYRKLIILHLTWEDLEI